MSTSAATHIQLIKITLVIIITSVRFVDHSEYLGFCFLEGILANLMPLLGNDRVEMTGNDGREMQQKVHGWMRTINDSKPQGPHKNYYFFIVLAPQTNFQLATLLWGGSRKLDGRCRETSTNEVETICVAIKKYGKICFSL